MATRAAKKRSWWCPKVRCDRVRLSDGNLQTDIPETWSCVFQSRIGLSTCLSLSANVTLCMGIYTYISYHMYISTCVRTHTHIYIYIYAIYLSIYLSIYLYIFIHMCVYTYIYIYIYTWDTFKDASTCVWVVYTVAGFADV